MKNIVIASILALGAFGISANIENDTKIAFVDKELVMNELKEAQKLKAEFEQAQAKFKIKEASSTAELELKMQKLAQNRETQSDLAEVIAKRDEIAKMNKAELKEIEEEIFGEFYTRLDKTMERIAFESGYNYVFNAKQSDGTPTALVYSEQDDLTWLVIKKMQSSR